MNSPEKTPENRTLRSDLLPNQGERWIDVAKRISDQIEELFVQNQRKTSENLLGENETPFEFLHKYIGDEDALPRGLELSDEEIKNIEDLVLIHGQLQTDERNGLNKYLRKIFQEKTPSN